MKTLVFVAVAIAAGAQAREPQNLAALVDEMVVLERVLEAALNSQATESPEYRAAVRATRGATGRYLRPWRHEPVRTIETEYLVRQGILVSLQLDRRPTVHDLPDALFTTMARTGETRLPIPLASLEPDDLVELKRLVDEEDETQTKHRELVESWQTELRDAAAKGMPPAVREDSSRIGKEVIAMRAKVQELQTAINAEIERLRGLVKPGKETSTDDVHGALMQAVCDYAMLKSVPDDEHLTLKVGEERARQDGGTLRQWTYYVLAKHDVVECRRGSINAAELRQRADVYSLPHD